MNQPLNVLTYGIGRLTVSGTAAASTGVNAVGTLLLFR